MERTIQVLACKVSERKLVKVFIGVPSSGYIFTACRDEDLVEGNF